MRFFISLLCFLAFAPGAFSAETSYSSQWANSWEVSPGDGQIRYCTRYMIYDLKRTAEEDALDKCRAASGSVCAPLGSYVIFNGEAHGKEQIRLLGLEYNPYSFGTGYVGCVVKATARPVR